MAETKPKIVMRSGPIVGSSFYIDKAEVSIGRDNSSDIAVLDPEISRRHARFIVKTDGVYIEDLGSTNGTFLNGVRLNTAKRLTNGDLITLAKETAMSFEWEQAAIHAQQVPTYSAHQVVEEAEPTKPEPVYQNVEQPQPQKPLLSEVGRNEKPRRSWFANCLIIALVIVIIVGLVLTFMPASWWCFLTFNRLPGCY